MKNLFKFYNKKDIPWVYLIWQAHYSNGQIPHAKNVKASFWWKDCLTMMDSFRALAKCEINKGDTILLWKDKWDDSIREDYYPHLFSFAKDVNLSMEKAGHVTNEDIYDLFHLPLSTIAHQELSDLQDEIRDIDFSNNPDSWIFPWGTEYSTKKVYLSLIGEHSTPKPILDIWKTCCVPRQKFFAWLLLYGKLNTKDMMKKKNFFVQFSNCILCDTCPEECIMHLFFECSFSQSFWWALGFDWNSDYDINSMITEAKTRYSINFLMEILITGCWSIWEQRNDAIFR